MRWPRSRAARAEAAARVAEARAHAEKAAEQVEVSIRRAESVRAHVNEPRWEFATQNQFADMLHRTLAERDEQ